MDVITNSLRSLNLGTNPQATEKASATTSECKTYSPDGTPFEINTGPIDPIVQEILDKISSDRFNFIPADKIREALSKYEHLKSEEIDKFSGSWTKLAQDPYYVEHGEHWHHRHYTLLEVSLDGQEHVQIAPRRSPSYGKTSLSPLTPAGMNELLPRVDDATFNSPVTKALVGLTIDSIRHLRPGVKKCEIEFHQASVTADKKGIDPAPERTHQDGADYVFIYMMGCKNVTGGSTTIRHDPDKADERDRAQTLRDQFEAVFIDDKKVWHEIGKIFPEKEGEESHRDILVIKMKALEE